MLVKSQPLVLICEIMFNSRYRLLLVTLFAIGFPPLSWRKQSAIPCRHFNTTLLVRQFKMLEISINRKYRSILPVTWFALQSLSNGSLVDNCMDPRYFVWNSGKLFIISTRVSFNWPRLQALGRKLHYWSQQNVLDFCLRYPNLNRLVLNRWNLIVPLQLHY